MSLIERGISHPSVDRMVLVVPKYFQRSTMFLTVAIPTYNRAQKLQRLLSQFSKLDTRFPLKDLGVEILVSNNASTDTTQEIAQEEKEINLH